MAVLDEAFARQAEIITELRVERDDALRRCDRLNGKLVSERQQLVAAVRQRDQLASRLASILSIELSAAQRGASLPKTGHASSVADVRGGSYLAGGRSGAQSARRPQSAPPKRVLKTEKELEASVTHLYKTSIAKKKESLKQLENKIYEPMEKKREGRKLKTKAELGQNVKKLYTDACKHREATRKKLEAKRAAEAQRDGKKMTKSEMEQSGNRLSSASYVSASYR
ncbi:hypothetical protein T492DRAFT_833513 [Pavlovales sp. CCMP2436]|nr:hypothetical protein T492DRAFT_833513 [Pavlovales sp. CCMP2436]|mmetsp:Transcript_5616/g.14040  ORF Transcript_5616/g.14040 Transcript_5616/m.14040 type:complete len:226 (-) Transcript_5616:114-791(-)